MTDEKILEVIELYENAVKEVFEEDKELTLPIEHISTMMLPNMKVFLQQGRREKAFRWLGFVQGVLWCEMWFDIDELKEHNKENE